MPFDNFDSALDSLIAPARNCFPIIPNDAGNLKSLPNAIYVGTGGMSPCALWIVAKMSPFQSRKWERDRCPSDDRSSNRNHGQQPCGPDQMPRVGLDFGQSPRRSLAGDKFILSQSISHAGVTFTFWLLRPAGQFANGDWWVQGPVTITAITPGSFVRASGLNGDGTAYINRTVHGTMVNPGKHSFAAGGLTANNITNTVQGCDSIGSSKPQFAYSGAANVDPGATGVPLTLTTGKRQVHLST